MIFQTPISSLFGGTSTQAATDTTSPLKQVAKSFIGFTVAIAFTGLGLFDGGMRYLANTYGYKGPEPDLDLSERDISTFDQAYKDLGL